MSLAEALERAATALESDADAIRPANGDPDRLLTGLDVPAAARVLTWLLCEEPEAGVELALAWAQGDAGSQIVAGLDESALARPGRKALRRARHALRSRGVAVPEPAPEPVVASLPVVEEAIEAGLVSPVDPLGQQLVFLLEPNPGGGVRLFELVLDEARGVLQCEVYQVTRKQCRRFLRAAQSRQDMPTVPADPSALRALCARVAAAQPADRQPPRAFRDWRAHLCAAEGAGTPGAAVRAALAGEAGDAARAAVLVRERQVGPWPPAPEVLRAEAERAREAGSSVVIVSEATERERKDSLVREAAGRVFDPAHAAASARRFEETAYVLWRREREADARDCLAAADALGSDAPGDSEVAWALLEVVLEPVLAKLAAEESESPLVKP